MDNIYAELAARHGFTPDRPPGVEDTQVLPVITPAAYRYSDPVTDPAWPQITEPDDTCPPDAFPATWGDSPTERDQAAIDAGNG